ncbi:hypothetical protein LSCM1_03422 [Leishmania martiniquensis]|uniref:Uncharacterized protein n=1 Tax=Leishmania martiniquensis TaxID=1580590 RepID=A0A836KGJ8_9TRYP|nr:hypothetical protein LSCM1_03422 [Leishmania martiniquensis]
MSFPSNSNTSFTAQRCDDAASRTFSLGRENAASALLFEGSARPRHASPHRQRNYGTMRESRFGMVRSASMPETLSCVVHVRKHSRQRSVAQQSAWLAEKAKQNFFHGSFTSAHGSVFTVPNRAQQMATNRPSLGPLMRRPSISRNTSAAPRRPTPISLIVAPAVSAMKNSAGLSSAAGVDSREGSYLRALSPPKDWSFEEELIVLPRRSVSTDARLGEHHGVDTNAAAGRLRRTIRSVNSSTEGVAKMEFRESSPDLLAVQLMRDRRAEQEKRQPLSPATIARALRALRAFEERKVRMPSGSYSNARVITYAGNVIPVPDHTPLVLSAAKSERSTRAEVPRCVHINSDAEDNVVDDATTVSGGDEDENVEFQESFSWCGAAMDLLYLAMPAAVSICFTFSISAMPLAFVGSYLGPRQLTGASVGFFLISILIIYPMIGLTFALDTLCSHEYGRDPLSPEMGLALQRGALINLIILLPLCVCIYFFHGILVPLYGEALAQEAEQFLLYSPLYLIPMVLFIAVNKFLNNQMQPHIPMIALTAGVLVTPFLQLKLTPMGVRYTMVGMAITAWLQLAVVMVVTVFKPETRITLGRWRPTEALDWTHVKEYMKLAIPSAIFVAAEASSFDVTVLMCARFGEMDGAAWSSIMNCLFIFASIPGGLSASACANIGRCIGAYEPACAKDFAAIAICTTFAMGLFDSALLVMFFDQLMSLFGTQGSTLALAREVLFLLPVFHVCDAVQFAFQGIFSGMGRNYVGAVILLTSLWGVGVPLAFTLGEYFNYRMLGVCAGITVGLCIEAPVMAYAASTTDYVAVCEKFMEDEESAVTEESEASEAYDDEYVEEVMRRSGISISNAEVMEGNSEHYRKLLPPLRRGRSRRVARYQDEDN